MVFGNMGETIRHRRRFHPQPLDGRQGTLRRVPRQRPGRGCRRRHSHAAEYHGSRAQGRRFRSAVAGSDHASGVQAVRRDDALLERHYKDVQDLEFTVERGKLWMLQTRNGKRTARAALRIAVDLAHEGVITQEEAISRIEPRRSTSCCTRRSTRGQARPDRHRPAGFAGRGERRDRIFGRRSRSDAPSGPQDDPGARRDFP